MDLGLDGRLALVTGASSGIGEGVARILVQEGCRVLVNARHSSKLEIVSDEIGAEAFFSADVSTASGVNKLVDWVTNRFGLLDVLVCNVGSGRSLTGLQEGLAEWEMMLRINLFSATLLVKTIAPLMRGAGGSIVCVSSICGLESLGAPLAYSAAKAALNSYVRGASRHLAPDSIRINAIAPGNIIFPGSVWESKLKTDAIGVKQMISREVALGRFGTINEVASCVVFLASPLSAFVTGEVFVVDGGQVKS